MHRIRIREVSPRSLFVDQICRDNGFACNVADGLRRHEVLRQHFKTSIYNSEHLWEKDGRLWLFDGWVTDTPGDCNTWNELELVDVTDLVTFDERGV